MSENPVSIDVDAPHEYVVLTHSGVAYGPFADEAAAHAFYMEMHPTHRADAMPRKNHGYILTPPSQYALPSVRWSLPKPIYYHHAVTLTVDQMREVLALGTPMTLKAKEYMEYAVHAFDTKTAPAAIDDEYVAAQRAREEQRRRAQRAMLMQTHARNEMRSQKARGVRWLSDRNTHSVPPVTYWPSLPTFERLSLEREHLQPKHGYPCFARPCPTVPRHGFVDSRVVQSQEEARALHDEAAQADPNAELMLMPLIDAEASAVVTPTWAAIGVGHDGATAGKAGTIAVQLLHTNIERIDALIPEGQVPYMEVVYGTYQRPNSASGNSDRQPWLVQLRSGPPIGDQGAGNYIPKDTVVSRVVDASALDALELEATLNEADANGALEGLVIWQAGGNPCSHAACHARLHTLPIVFDYSEPAIGTRLAKTHESDVPMNADAMAHAVRYWGSSDVSLDERMPDAYLWAVHQAPALARSAAGAEYVGYACAMLWRYAATACIGEARHSRYLGLKTLRRRRRTPDRGKIYTRALAKPATDAYLRGRCAIACAAFEMEDNFSSGYGGKAWAQCSRAAIALYDALAALSQGKGTANELVLAAHAVVNSAHNNGPFLSKFIGSDSFDLAAHGNQFQALRGLRAVFDYARRGHTYANKAWPLRRHRSPRVPDVTRVRWCLRMDGTAVHAQYVQRESSSESEAKYISATVPLAALSADTQARIAVVVAFAAPSMRSAASDKPYWPAQDVLDDTALIALFPNT